VSTQHQTILLFFSMVTASLAITVRRLLNQAPRRNCLYHFCQKPLSKWRRFLGEHFCCDGCAQLDRVFISEQSIQTLASYQIPKPEPIRPVLARPVAGFFDEAGSAFVEFVLLASILVFTALGVSYVAHHAAEIINHCRQEIVDYARRTVEEGQ
jgi:hypothetical protein